MIYFDENKNAYGFEIETPIATIDDKTWALFQKTGEDSWDIVDGEFIDKTQSQEYQAIQLLKTQNYKKEKLKREIEELDLKRIRAIAEPSLKDEETTWLQFYTEQIQLKRSELESL